MWLPGVSVAAAAALAAWGIHALFPAVPLLTAAVVLGILVAQLPAARAALTGVLASGLSVASKRFMRIGIVLLGLKLSLVDIAGLGAVAIASTVAIVLLTFGGTYWLGRWFRLPGHQPLLIATGFSICGASAIGAMSGVVKARDEETATPVALVTLCGTLAIGVLPALWHPLGLTTLQFGHWVGAGVHDVGQVVATAQIAGSAALAVAVVVKLTRVLMLAPIVFGASVVEHRRSAARRVERDRTGRNGRNGLLDPDADVVTKRPPIVPLFVAGFIVAVVVRTSLPVPPVVLQTTDAAQTALLAMALFGLGTAVRLGALLRTGWRALVVGLLSWVLIAALAFGAVQLA
ncbi:YeiH family protein [Glaciibacter sp. 2TAF33]|uniref:YeiH family protein n=1 Tax=Glaciibacter sp. 2TAF33 TaxID=3233015 RepID=UPI003F920B96